MLVSKQLLGYSLKFNRVNLIFMFVFAFLEFIFLGFVSVILLILLKILILSKICHPLIY